MSIGKIERVELREVWKHEALNFTTWLEHNIDTLNEQLNIDLTVVDREKSAGSFNVDLVAEDGNGNVIIENQLEKSNHDHLGKVLTYLTMLEARSAIWIVADPRPEHVRVFSWLNDSTSSAFYLVKMEAIKIGNSQPAPLFTVIVEPSDDSISAGTVKKELVERHKLRKEWWASLLEIASKKTILHSNISPKIYSWIGTGAGKAGLAYNYCVSQTETWVELYIDKGKENEEINKEIFDALHKNENEIEKNFGGKLDWQRLDSKRACRIKSVVKGGYRNDPEEWEKIHTEAVDKMIRFEKALSPFIKKLNI